MINGFRHAMKAGLIDASQPLQVVWGTKKQIEKLLAKHLKRDIKRGDIVFLRRERTVKNKK